jgi:uncharacterized membrane protein YqjE
MRFSTMIAVTVVLMILGSVVCRVALKEFNAARASDNKVLVEALR